MTKIIQPKFETFHHIFSSGRKLMVQVDLSGHTLKIKADKIDPKDAAEYRIWLMNILAPEIASKLTPEQAISTMLAVLS